MSVATADSLPVEKAEAIVDSPARRAWRRLRARKGAMVGLAVILAFVAFAALAP